MKRREELIRLWFDMWIRKTDMGIDDVFTDNAIYTESWGPEYHGLNNIKLWFNECITRQDVLKWDIEQFIHKDNQSVVQWYFKYQDTGKEPNAFYGISLVKWSSDDKIISLTEFGCNEHHYDPYKNGTTPQFENSSAMWF